MGAMGALAPTIAPTILRKKGYFKYCRKKLLTLSIHIINILTMCLLITIMMKGLLQNPTMLHQISYFDLRNLTQI